MADALSTRPRTPQPAKPADERSEESRRFAAVRDAQTVIGPGTICDAGEGGMRTAP